MEQIDSRYVLDDDVELVTGQFASTFKPNRKTTLGYDLSVRKNYLKDITLRGHKCKWCNTILYIKQQAYCCQDCKEEYSDWSALNTTKKHLETRPKKVKKVLTPEEKRMIKREYTRKNYIKQLANKKKWYLKHRTEILKRKSEREKAYRREQKLLKLTQTK
jgi:hypothetical protein